MEIMKTVEKRDYIHSHLHQIDENFINEVYQKIRVLIDKKDPVIGYDASGKPIKKNQFVAEIKEAENQIEKGEYITIEELEKESETW